MIWMIRLFFKEGADMFLFVCQVEQMPEGEVSYDVTWTYLELSAMTVWSEFFKKNQNILNLYGLLKIYL